MKLKTIIFKEAIPVFSGIIVLAGLYLINLYNYLVFHAFGEMFSIAVSFGIFMIAWNLKQFIENNFFLFLGISCLFIGSIDLLHTLTYKGMGVFQGYDSNLPTQLWIAGRYTQGLSFMLSFMLMNRKINAHVVSTGFSIWTSLLLLAIFYWNIFPDSFIEGTGLTLFKKLSEYVICLILAASIFLLYQKQKEFDPKVFKFLFAALAVSIFSELAFTFYTSVYGLFNLAGHFLKIISWYFVYRALIETGLTKPYGLLFRELKQREKALQESQAIYEAMFQNNGAVKLLVNPDTADIVDANLGACEFYGYSIETLKSMKITDINILPVEQVTEKMNIVRTGQNKYFQAQHRMASGEIRDVEVYSGPIEIEEQVLLFSIIHDITKRRQAEQELKIAQKASETANRAKSAFLASMSHELRTPLNGILGYAQILKGESDITGNQIEGLDIIEKSGQHLLSLLNDILDIAKVESGKIELHETDFSFPDFIQSICDNIRIRTEKKGLMFVNENNNLPLYVHADERRLRQVLLNLLGNSVKFTEKGSIRLRVKKENPGISFFIEDTGIGIPPDDLKTIFDPFHQAGEQKYQVQGTGLGLSITQNLIEIMGGKLEVSSKAGLGSTFSFKLEIPEVSFDKEYKSQKQEKIIGIRGKAPKILMVDDNRFNRAVFKSLLCSYGFEIIEAGNGREGLAKAMEFKPDVIITDIVMPEMDGIELIRQIRQSPDLKDKIIFAASASVYHEDQENCIKAGADGFIPKPIEAGHITEQLQQLLGLEWIYEEIDEKVCNKETDELILPSDEILKELKSFARIGDIVKTRNMVEHLAQSDESLKAFTNNLQPLVKNFMLEEIEILMEKYLEPGTKKMNS